MFEKKKNLNDETNFIDCKYKRTPQKLRVVSDLRSGLNFLSCNLQFVFDVIFFCFCFFINKKYKEIIILFFLLVFSKTKKKYNIKRSQKVMLYIQICTYKIA